MKEYKNHTKKVIDCMQELFAVNEFDNFSCVTAMLFLTAGIMEKNGAPKEEFLTAANLSWDIIKINKVK